MHLIDVERQIRTQFDPEKQASINASIKAQGIHQSLVLLAKPDGRYKLIAGEYRYRGAEANSLEEVPARIRHNLSDWEIRRIQVSENLERTDISAYDEAIGVAEDVEKYGFEQAKVIWNRSDGWISKRTAVLKYAQPVRQLLKDRKCEDLEVAHSLNQLYELAQPEYERLAKRLQDGLPLSREEARGKVQHVKEWLNETKQRDARRQTLAKPLAKGKETAKAGGVHKDAAARGPAAAARAPVQHAPAGAGATSTSAVQATSGAAKEPAGQPVAEDSAPQITDEQALVLDQMVTLFQNAVANHGLVKDVQAELENLGADMNQTEWAMWSLFQTAALPLLAALGETRAQRYLQRAIAELRTAKPQELWSKLHPTADGTASDDWAAQRTPVAPMPKDWRF
jgi:ParB family chromosome partitioning protein